MKIRKYKGTRTMMKVEATVVSLSQGWSSLGRWTWGRGGGDWTGARLSRHRLNCIVKAHEWETVPGVTIEQGVRTEIHTQKYNFKTSL